MDSHCLKSVGVGPVTRLGSWKRLDMSWSRGRGERGLLGRGVSVSACAYTLSRSAYCLLPTAYCLCCAAVSHVCVCVCVRRIDSRSKTILLGSQVSVCVGVGGVGASVRSKSRMYPYPRANFEPFWSSASSTEQQRQ